LAEKMRVHILAKELNVPSKTIIEKCKAEGIDTVKNHMSTLSAGLHATIKEWFSDGSRHTAVETAQRIDLDKVRTQTKPAKKAVTADSDDDSSETDEGAIATAEAPPEPKADSKVTDAAVEAPQAPAAPTASADEPEQPASAAPTVEEAEAQPDTGGADVDAGQAAAEVPPAASEVDESTPEAAPGDEDFLDDESKEPVGPAGPQNVPRAAKLQGPRVVRYEAPEYDTFRPKRSGGPPARDAAEVDAGPRRGGPSGGGRSGGRRGTGRGGGSGERTGWRDRDLMERRERLAGATGRRIHRRRTAQRSGGGAAAQVGPKTKARVHEPVHLKEFCAETGLNFMQLFKVLKAEHDIMANINMAIPTETAQLLALHFGIELEVIPARTKLDELQEAFDQREVKNLEPRPPVVTVLGHVDHGKTSLLDAIRKTHVASGEDGGITQHINSYHISTSRGPVTFVDTPGHEAFTAMRARGAEITDVVVLVVATDDGIMPQTVEAIRHAQAAEVPIVVAINKIDLGDQNVVKIYGQLTEHGLTPSGDWGGDTDVIRTSATTKEGVTELVEHLADLSSVLELQADPTLPAIGTTIEAETKPGVGAVVRLLVQEGTLKVGDLVVCGNAFGKVRALLGDRGQRVKKAGPSVPVEVWGLDDVPVSGDKLYVVDSMRQAKEIATETKQTRLEAARLQSRKVKSLEEMFKRKDADEVPELNVVIKADVDGSLAALRQSLMEIPSDEVRLAIRHAAVGPVNDSDVLLASTSHGIVLAFRVEVPVGTRRLGEQQGVDIRSYRVIYDCCDDIRQALSGLLAPEQRVQPRATVEVRQVFRVSKAGMVAGCYVTDGVINRNHLAKVMRDGTVIRQGCKLASLKHFKDDVKEVRAGLECGLRLEGFDDVHVGDIIETYEIVEIARSL